MIDVAMKPFRDMGEEKNVKDYVPSFLKDEYSKSSKGIDIYEPVIKHDEVPDFMKKILKKDEYSDEKIGEIHLLDDHDKKQKIQDFMDGKIGFEEVKDILANEYAEMVNLNRPWTWNEDVSGGVNLTAGQKKAIREYARENGLVPVVPMYEQNGKTYADFSEFKDFECVLEKEDWDKTDDKQFEKCNQMLKKEIGKNPDLAKKFTKEQLEQINEGNTPSGYTWHHSEKDGTMQLVPYGVHNATNHFGGRSEGSWADFSRQ